MLEQQSAVVVGAGGLIGGAVTRRYLKEGARVVAVDRDAARLAELRRELGGEVETLALDASSWEASQAMVARAVEAHGRLDVLVSCTGVYDQGAALEDIPGDRLAAAFTECFTVNVASLLLNVRAALPQLVANRGRVVLTASYASFLPAGGGVLYTAAKHAVVGVVRQLAYELAPDVRVNAVAPGVAASVMTGLETLGQEPRSAVLPGTEAVLPLGRVPDPAEFASVYALLGSATEAGALTGEVVRVDSGLAVRGLSRPGGRSPQEPS